MFTQIFWKFILSLVCALFWSTPGGPKDDILEELIFSYASKPNIFSHFAISDIKFSLWN